MFCVRVALTGLLRFSCLFLFCLPLGQVYSNQEGEADKVASLSYNKDIRPLLAENCFSCHGPDSASRKADLRLDQREAAIEMSAIVPGEPDESQIIDRILRDEGDELLMPPVAAHKKMTAEEKEILVQWVREGAHYEPHWSLTPPVRPAVPNPAEEGWVRNPIDAFVLEKLKAAGLSPAPEADRHVLARRLALDLTGLPPTPEQVNAFVNDASDDYYEKYVDSLLESVRWGEHRGRYWLDYARYADTHGIHFDNFREVWAYRDWVIQAFNQNMPFDQFSIEQLAGDMLPNRTLDQLVATGFSRCNITTNEGGVIEEEYRVLYARDRTETMATVWLGMTAGCAVCHDHKFDPLSMQDFYSLSAFFNNTTQPVMDGNVPNTPPIITVPLMEDRARWELIGKEIEVAKQQVADARTAARSIFDTLAASDPQGGIDVKTLREAIPVESLQLHAPLSQGAGPAVLAVEDGRLRQQVAAADFTWGAGHVAPYALQVSGQATAEWASAGNFERDQAFSVAAWVWLPADNTGGSIVARMDDGKDFRGWDLWLEGNRLGAHVINKWPENALKVVTGPAIPKETWTHVVFTYDGSSQADGLQFYVNGTRRTERNVANSNLTESILTEVPLKLGMRHNSSRIDGARMNDVRVYSSKLLEEQCRALALHSRVEYLAARPAAIRSDAENEELFAWWLNEHADDYRKAKQTEDTLVAEQEAIRRRGTIAHVMNEADKEAEAFILARGEYDQRGERVTANTPSALPPMAPDLPKNRLGLAQWLFTPQHPLTSRVTVNRFWQEVFGNGLVLSAGDFGISGDLPSHPELLDYLAVEFRESGWDVKDFFRLMVTSATYRQAALHTAEKLERDPQNRLLSRGPRFRMDAEMVRDLALAVSGQLSPKIGGASVRPYQPEGVWEAVAMPGSNTRDYVVDKGEGLYRRSMYTFWKRSAPPASMDIMNAPSRETCTVRRERTNTPLQALVTLNDPQCIEAARQLAAQALAVSSDPQTRVNFMMQRLVSRDASEREWPIIARSLQKLSDYYSNNKADTEALLQLGESPVDANLPPGELAAWTMLGNQLMNLDEVLNK